MKAVQAKLQAKSLRAEGRTVSELVKKALAGLTAQHSANLAGSIFAGSAPGTDSTALARCRHSHSRAVYGDRAPQNSSQRRRYPSGWRVPSS